MALTICPRRMSQASAISAISASASQGVARSLGDHHEVRLTNSMRSMVKYRQYRCIRLASCALCVFHVNSCYVFHVFNVFLCSCIVVPTVVPLWGKRSGSGPGVRSACPPPTPFGAQPRRVVARLRVPHAATPRRCGSPCPNETTQRLEVTVEATLEATRSI